MAHDQYRLVSQTVLLLLSKGLEITSGTLCSLVVCTFVLFRFLFVQRRLYSIDSFRAEEFRKHCSDNEIV